MASHAPHSTRVAPLAVVGGGNMAQAILRGGIDASVLEPSRIGIAEPDATKRDLLRGWGISCHASIGEMGGKGGWIARHDGDGAAPILLAVKPQSLAGVAAELRSVLPQRRRIIISILAGTPSRRVRESLGPWAAVIRVMPNTAARIRRGTAGVAAGDGARPGDERGAVVLFGAVGAVFRIEEGMMDAFTAIAGSGPAYVFYLAEAMARAAAELGFGAGEGGQADGIVRSTICGAAALLEADAADPRSLRAAVTSKGGTTEAATAVLNERGVKEAFIAALRAARDRAAELARGG